MLFVDVISWISKEMMCARGATVNAQNSWKQNETMIMSGRSLSEKILTIELISSNFPRNSAGLPQPVEKNAGGGRRQPRGNSLALLLLCNSYFVFLHSWFRHSNGMLVDTVDLSMMITSYIESGIYFLAIRCFFIIINRDLFIYWVFIHFFTLRPTSFVRSFNKFYFHKFQERKSISYLKNK